MKKLILLLMCLCMVGCTADKSDGTSASADSTAASYAVETVEETTVSETTAAEAATETGETTISEAATEALMETTEAVQETAAVSETTAAAATSAATLDAVVETTPAVTTAAVTTVKTEKVTAKPAEKPQVESVVIEAEDAVLYGGLSKADIDGFSGGKGVGMFSEQGQYIEFSVDIKESGVYDFTFTGKGIGSDKENVISVDGKNVGNVKHLNEKTSDGTITNIILEKGKHTVTLTQSWGWIYLDKMTVEAAEGISDSVYNVKAELINPNATAEAKSLFRFLCDNYGEKILSGQVCDYGVNGPEFKAIKAETGKYPAVLGLDMMDYSTARTANGAKGSSVDVAIDFCNNQGGIVAYCWHWNAPNEYLKDGSDSDNGNPRWWGGFYTRNSDFDIAKVMDGKDPEGKALLDKDIEEIAKQLNRLEEEGVPVLWRPLHEASGGWFWWGAKGADAYKKLWIYLYDQLTDVYECNNLIWVYNGQSAEWYPGDEYVDIIGEDIYTDKRNYQPQTSKFAEAVSYSEKNKIVALTENGVLFDIDDAFAANAKWAWFNTWCGDFTVKNLKYNDEYTEKAMLKEVYGSDKVITLDELPDLKNYK